jgi:hypothetical protein
VPALALLADVTETVSAVMNAFSLRAIALGMDGFARHVMVKKLLFLIADVRPGLGEQATLR